MPENGERGNFHKKEYVTLGGCSEVIRYKVGSGDNRLGKGDKNCFFLQRQDLNIFMYFAIVSQYPPLSK